MDHRGTGATAASLANQQLLDEGISVEVRR
jgi:hypothetical protein